jgi:cell division septum initiation protein DivIVA
VAQSDDEVLLDRLRKLSKQLDAAKQSADRTVKEVVRAKETSERARQAAAPVRPSRARRRRRASGKK